MSGRKSSSREPTIDNLFKGQRRKKSSRSRADPSEEVGYNLLSALLVLGLIYSIVASSLGLASFVRTMNYVELENNVGTISLNVGMLIRSVELLLQPIKAETKDYIPTPTTNSPFYIDQSMEHVNFYYYGATYEIFKNVNASGLVFTTGSSIPQNTSVIYIKILQGSDGLSSDSIGNISVVAAGALTNITAANTSYYLTFTDGPVLLTSGVVHLLWAGSVNSTFALRSYSVGKLSVLNVDLYPSTIPCSYTVRKNVTQEFDTLDVVTDLVAATTTAIGLPIIRFIGPDLAGLSTS
jgi:hypothetical protein